MGEKLVEVIMDILKLHVTPMVLCSRIYNPWKITSEKYQDQFNFVVPSH